MQSEFDTVRKGYKKEQVDSYINYLENIIDGYVQKEKVAENLIKRTEQQAYNLIQEAEVQSAQIIQKAEQDAENITLEAYGKLHAIQKTINDQNTLLDDFRKDYNRFILKYVNEVNKTTFVNLKKAVSDIDTYIENTIKNAENTNGGYFVPNTQSLNPIMIVEPDSSDFELDIDNTNSLDFEANNITEQESSDLTKDINTQKNLSNTELEKDDSENIAKLETDDTHILESYTKLNIGEISPITLETLKNQDINPQVTIENKNFIETETELLNLTINDSFENVLNIEKTIELKEIQSSILALETNGDKSDN